MARRTIVALDFDDGEKAVATVDRLGAAGRSYKVGLELLTATGPAIVTRLVDAGKDVFLDLKLFEIPASVAGPSGPPAGSARPWSPCTPWAAPRSWTPQSAPPADFPACGSSR